MRLANVSNARDLKMWRTTRASGCEPAMRSPAGTDPGNTGEYLQQPMSHAHMRTAMQCHAMPCSRNTCYASLMNARM